MPDFFDISRHLTDEEKAIKTSVRKFVDARVLPTIGEHFEKGTFPVELIPEIAELGLLGCNLQGYGCAGLSDTGYGVAMAETVCVGDWLNDLPMLKAAGRSFAMGQAPAEVKSAATDVLTKTITTGGGIAEAIARAFPG